MTETADIDKSWHSAEPSAEELAERRFRLAVGGLTLLPALFLALRLTAWPPHEDETLALFVGRHSLGDLFGVVLDERGGAPLHFLVAWAVAHLGLGLEGLRAASALFAVASVPVIAALVRRLSDRRTALVATALVVASWMLLFHGVYGRMYSLFLFTSALSYLALLVASERGGWWRWALWVLAILAVVATHPYGALVLASQGLYVVLAARDRFRGALAAFAAVAVLGIPFWLTDLVLAGRFDVGVGGGGEKLSGPVSLMNYLAETLGDFTAGWPPTVALAVLGTAVGIVLLGRERRRAAILIGCAAGVPVAAFLAARLGGNTSPESRHLIFVLPFAALALAAALLALVARNAAAGWGLIAVLLVAEVAWGWHKTPPLFEGEPSSRVAARTEAADWLARTSRPNDVLFGYDPLFLGAWERNGDFSSIVVPRADVKLALTTMRKAAKPLGRGVWVFDSSDTNNFDPSPVIRLVSPQPASDFESRAFGPFLVIRTREPTRTPANYFRQARRAQLVGKALYLGDADINYQTVVRAGRRLGLYTPRSRSISSR